MAKQYTFVFKLPEECTDYDDVMSWVKYGKGTTSKFNSVFSKFDISPSCEEKLFFNEKDSSITILLRLDLVEKEEEETKPKRPRGRPRKGHIVTVNPTEEWETTEDLRGQNN